MFTEAVRGRRVLVLGDVMLDHFVYGAATRVSPEAPALVLRVDREFWSLGGAGNVAANIVALGGRAILIGLIGADAAGGQARTLAAQLGPGLEPALVVQNGAPTITKTRYIAGDRHLLRADREAPGLTAAAEAKLIAAVLGAMAECDALAVSDYAKGVASDAVLAAALDAAGSAGKPVVVDPKRRDFAAYRGATVLKPNRKELTEATGIDCADDDGCDRAASRVVEETGAAVLLTRSEKGVALYRTDRPPWRDRARAAQVRDVSGAGDTALAALSLGLAADLDLVDAAHAANVAAGVAVGKSGTSTVDARELQAALVAPVLGPAPQGKVVDLETAVGWRRRWQAEGLHVGFTNGCFDLLHPGHARLLRVAAETCDRLIVAVNSDASVRRLKGPGRPVQSQASRAELLGAMAGVDLVVIFEEDTPLACVQALQPDVIVKGADYAEDEVVGGALVKAGGGRVVLVDLLEGQSTTRLIAGAD